MLSALLQLTASDFPFGIFKLFLHMIGRSMMNEKLSDLTPNGLGFRFMVLNATFQQYFIYIFAVSLIGEGNRSTRRKPATCHKLWKTLSTPNGMLLDGSVSTSEKCEKTYNKHIILIRLSTYQTQIHDSNIIFSHVRYWCNINHQIIITFGFIGLVGPIVFTFVLQ